MTLPDAPVTVAHAPVQPEKFPCSPKSSTSKNRKKNQSSDNSKLFVRSIHSLVFGSSFWALRVIVVDWNSQDFPVGVRPNIRHTELCTTFSARLIDCHQTFFNLSLVLHSNKFFEMFFWGLAEWAGSISLFQNSPYCFHFFQKSCLSHTHVWLTKHTFVWSKFGFTVK